MLNDTKPLVVPGALESLSALRQYTADACASFGLPADRTYGLTLAVDEVATNIVVHGYRENGLEGTISIVCQIDGSSLRVTLEDTSPEFDAGKLAAPPAEDLGKPLEERRMGGLGVYMALQSVDVFEYRRVGGVNRNTFIMRKTLH